MRVLIVRLTALGDIIHGLPVAAFLKKRLPDCHITWVVEQGGTELVRNNPAIDKVIVFPLKSWLKRIRRISEWGKVKDEVVAFCQELRESRYDAALDLHGLFKSAMVSVVSGAPVRLGYKGARDGAFMFMTHNVDVGEYFGHDVHVVDLNLKLAHYFVNSVVPGFDTVSDISATAATSSLPSYIYDPYFPLPVPPVETEKYINGLLASEPGGSDLAGRPLLVLIPGTTWKAKIWPSAHWVELGRELLSRGSYRLALVGGAAESESNQGIVRGIESGVDEKLRGSVLNLTAKTDLLGLIALYKQAHAVIGADTGPLHLAAALDTCPVVGIYGSTPARRNGPYGKRSHTIKMDLSCQPCFKTDCPLGTTACLVDLTPQAVLDEILKII